MSGTTPLSPLSEVAEHVRAHASREKIAVIFDLDSTLFCVSPRSQAILRVLADDPRFSTKHAAEAAILRDVEVRPSDWGIRTALERREFTTSLEVVETVKAYWREHFFSSRFLEHDILYPQAGEYVRHLAKLGANIYYLTGRNELDMREGTVRALEAASFPLTSPAHLIMKPTEVMSDEGFKADVLKELAPDFHYLWFFENEPVIIEQIRRRVPQVQIVFVNSVHAGRAAPPLGLRTILPDYSGPWIKPTSD